MANEILDIINRIKLKLEEIELFYESKGFEMIILGVKHDDIYNIIIVSMVYREISSITDSYGMQGKRMFAFIEVALKDIDDRVIVKEGMCPGWFSEYGLPIEGEMLDKLKHVYLDDGLDMWGIAEKSREIFGYIVSPMEIHTSLLNNKVFDYNVKGNIRSDGDIVPHYLMNSLIAQFNPSFKEALSKQDGMIMVDKV